MRKAKSEWELGLDANKTISQGLESDPSNESLLALRAEIKADYDADHAIDVNPEEKAKFDRFFAWLKENGAEFDKLKIRYYSQDYRGVHAARDIKKGETILHIPRGMLMSGEAIQSPIASKLKDNLHEFGRLVIGHRFGSVEYTVHLLEESCRPDSKWRPYLDILPTTLSNFPINFG